VSIENNFSLAKHVKRLVTASAQTIYALHVLRTRGLDDNALQHIYFATVVAHLMHAASAWLGVTKAPYRNRTDVLDRARRHQTCRRSTSCVTLTTTNYLAELCDCSINHVLHALIPPQSSASHAVTEIQPQTSHTLTTAAITHQTLVRLQLHHTNAVQRQIFGT